MKKDALIASVLWTVLGGAITQVSAQELVFVHSPACVYCEQWRKEIAPAYPKSDEAKLLPLREVNRDDGMPEDLSHVLYPAFTPTFIVMDGNNQEVGRIVGYNPEFFWPFLTSLAQKVDKNSPKAP